MSKYISIGEAAKFLGVSTQTLRRWELEGRISPDERTKGGQRRYDISKLRPQSFHADNHAARQTYAYARVSSHDQKPDLKRQVEMLEMYCAANGWTYSILQDLGSGLNYSKPGLKRLLNSIMLGEVGRLVITHKDRLLRFGAELIFSLCEMNQVEVVIINQGEQPTFEEELAQDVLEIITVFSARLYGSRSRKNKKLLQDLQSCVEQSHGSNTVSDKIKTRSR
jgi:predicted site-specific integrase-resolvase